MKSYKLLSSLALLAVLAYGACHANEINRGGPHCLPDQPCPPLNVK